MTRLLRALPRPHRQWLPDVFRDDAHLIGRVVELFGRAQMKPDDGGETIRGADGIDRSEKRGGGGLNAWLAIRGESESHIGCGHRNAVVPFRARIEMKRDTQRVG